MGMYLLPLISLPGQECQWVMDLPSPSQAMSPQERGCLWFDTSATCCSMGSFQSRTQRYKGNAVKASADLQSIHELSLVFMFKE